MILEMDKEYFVLPKGEYKFKYINDYFTELPNGYKFITMEFMVIDGEYNGKIVKYHTVSSNVNKKLNAIGASLRERVQVACLGKENMSLFKQILNSEILIGKTFIATADEKENKYNDLEPTMNVFKGFKNDLTDEDKLKIANELVSYMKKK